MSERDREKIRCVLIHSKVRKVLKKFILRSSTAGFLPFLPLFSGDDCFLIDPGGVGASFFFFAGAPVADVGP